MHFSYLLAALPVASAQLHTVAKGTGLLYFGTATGQAAFNDAPYQAALKNTSDFGQITPDNAMKWDATEPQPNKFTFEAGDAIAKLAQANNQLLRCHNLVWHQQLPSWVTGGNWTKATLTAALQNHVTSTVTHYKSQCYAWDVVNEALNDNGTFRNDIFFQTLGDDYIRIAFEAAAAADPDVKLYYNDFNTEFPGVKSTAAQAIVKKLKAANVKIDGVGFQAHFIVGGTPSMKSQMDNLAAFTTLGVEVAITELDIRMTLPSTPKLEQQQQIDYQTTTAACAATKGCVGVTVWDFDDKYSWVPSTFAGTGSACPFDENVVRKAAYAGAVSGLQLQLGNATSSNSTRKGPNSNGPNNNTTSNAPLKQNTSGSPRMEIGAATMVLGSFVFAALLI